LKDPEAALSLYRGEQSQRETFFDFEGFLAVPTKNNLINFLISSAGGRWAVVHGNARPNSGARSTGMKRRSVWGVLNDDA
jgi:hypothetical protein